MEYEVWTTGKNPRCIAICGSKKLAKLTAKLWSYPGEPLGCFKRRRLPQIVTAKDVKRLRPYYVNIARLGATGAIKVGVTSNITKRLSNITSNSPESIRLLALDGPYRRKALALRFESIIKKECQSDRVQGEWFAMNSHLAFEVGNFRKSCPEFATLLATLTEDEAARVEQEIEGVA